MGLTVRSYGYVCKAKNKATGLVRAVKTIAKARINQRHVGLGRGVFGLTVFRF